MTTYTKETANRDVADIVAVHFAGKVKTQEELREFIATINSAVPFHFKMIEDEMEAIARDNEVRQGVSMFA